MRLRLLLLLLALSLVGCDHATKELAHSEFRRAPESLLSGWLTLTYTENRDMAFGLLGHFAGEPARFWILTTAKAIAVLAGAAFLLARQVRTHVGVLLAIALVVAGAAGNLLDRILRGHVIDFLRIPHWPVFNVADIAICAGYGVLLLTMLRSRKPASHGSSPASP